MNQELISKRRILILSFLYGLLCFLAALFGVLLSLAAQPGGITQLNAFLAPFLGPWSQTLPPNPHPVSTWTAKYALFAKSLSLGLAFSLAGSYIAPGRWLKNASAGIAILLLIIWVFHYEIT